ncbi:MAG: ABC transporter permease, partial [Nanoarchaeota archaeon]
MIGALLGYSLGNLKTRALRSLLTIVSVMIGIAAITSLISFGNGISSYVDEMAQKMGNDKIIIQPRGFGFGPPPVDTNVVLDADDVDVIEDVHGVEEATGVYILSGEVEFDSKKKYVFMFGSDFQNHPELIKEVYALTLLEGNELRGREKNKALLGYNYQLAYKIFEKPMRLRDKIVINDHPFEVAGFYDEVGNPQDDSNVYITNEAAEEVFDAKNYHFILARSSPGSSPTDVSESIARSLRRHRNQERGQEDFFVQTFEQVIATFTSILGVITGVVVLIGLISVVVAAVNIMNTMYA